MRAIIIVASLVLALLTSAWGNDSTSPAPDNPQVATADRLLPACQQFDQLPSPSVTFFMAYDEGKCVGIILGLDEAADDVCIPNGVMVDQKVRAAIQYIVCGFGFGMISPTSQTIIPAYGVYTKQFDRRCHEIIAPETISTTKMAKRHGGDGAPSSREGVGRAKTLFTVQASQTRARPFC